MPSATPNAYSQVQALRSPETEAALNALVEYTGRSPDPRDPEHAPHLKRLQYAYIEAAQADGSFYLATALDSEKWAAEAEARALDYPDHAERYRKTADNHRWAATQARENLDAILNPQARRAAA